MKTAVTILGALVGAVALIGALVKDARWLWTAAGSSHDLIKTIKDNTTAVGDLADELRSLRVDVTGDLAARIPDWRAHDDRDPDR